MLSAGHVVETMNRLSEAELIVTMKYAVGHISSFTFFTSSESKCVATRTSYRF